MTALDTLRNVSNAIVHLKTAFQNERVGNTVDLEGLDKVRELELLAKGGYNSIWLVKLHEHLEIAQRSPLNQFVLRLPCEDSLLPNQITNEVAFKRFVAARLPHIPVPQVYTYQATSRHDTSFIAEEYIDGTPLSETWMTLTFSQKEHMARKLAKILVDLAEVQFDMIGGLDPLDFSPAPTVEGSKLFKGRGKFHKQECYPIGPYKSTKEYILSCYEREIYYYTHASDEQIDADLFAGTSVQTFVAELRKKRDSLAATDMIDEPFTLVHGDFHGRNILVRGDQITAVLDWEFAGSFPLSETLTGGGIDVVDANSVELDEENTEWNRRIRDFISQEAREKGWDRNKIDLLMGDGNQELGRAREEMFP